MQKLDARKSGSFKIGGEIEIHRLGFGAMRVTGPGIWGPPVDRAEAIRTLKRLRELGVDYVDTADSYGPEVSEELIRGVLYPDETPKPSSRIVSILRARLAALVPLPWK